MEKTITLHTLNNVQGDTGRDAVVSPVFGLEYNGQSISDSIARNLISFVYTDKLAGEADELSVVLEDSVGNFRRLYYPDKGAKLRARVGFPGAVVECGDFEIDEVAGSSPPDVITMRAVAAGLATVTLRTKRSKAHEAQTLAQIAGKVAAAHGLTVLGTIKPIQIARTSQFRSRDLKFLNKLAFDYGYIFSVRGKKLIFTNVFDLEKSAPVATIGRSDVESYTFTDRLNKTYTAAEVHHHNQKSKKLVKGRATAAAGTSTSADTLQIRRKVENQQQADAQAKAALHWHNSRACEYTLHMPGRPELVAGVTVRLNDDFGAGHGIYYVLTSTHAIDKESGYTTEITAKRLGN